MMESLQITGGHPLYGELTVQGSKNAALPILAAAILCQEEVILEHVPEIADVRTMEEILKELGCLVRREGSCLRIHAGGRTKDAVPEELCRKMRSSVLLLGPLLAIGGSGQISQPGGCSIGKRPIVYHLEGFRCFGAETSQQENVVCVQAEHLCGAEILLPYPSVGATENLILAAVLAEGKTEIRNCAREPEIRTLCAFLRQMGAKIRGDGSRRIRITGVRKLSGTKFRIPGDRIVAGTWLFAGAICGGALEVQGFPTEQLRGVYPVLRQMGCSLYPWKDGIFLQAPMRLYSAGDICTAPYPGFPTDLQSPLLALASVANGVTTLRESVFESRFETVKELQRMGADIELEDSCARIKGVWRLQGREVTAKDLRGGAALVLAGLQANGITTIHGWEHIARGYERLPEQLETVGARLGGRNGEKQTH